MKDLAAISNCLLCNSYFLFVAKRVEASALEGESASRILSQAQEELSHDCFCPCPTCAELIYQQPFHEWLQSSAPCVLTPCQYVTFGAAHPPLYSTDYVGEVWNLVQGEAPRALRSKGSDGNRIAFEVLRDHLPQIERSKPQISWQPSIELHSEKLFVGSEAKPEAPLQQRDEPAQAANAKGKANEGTKDDAENRHQYIVETIRRALQKAPQQKSSLLSRLGSLRPVYLDGNWAEIGSQLESITGQHSLAELSRSDNKREFLTRYHFKPIGSPPLMSKPGLADNR